MGIFPYFWNDYKYAIMTMEDLHFKLNSLALSGMADSCFIVAAKKRVKSPRHSRGTRKRSRHLIKDKNVQLSLFD